MTRNAIIVLSALGLTAASCGGTPTQPAAAPAMVSQTLTGSLSPGGSAVSPFSISEGGTVYFTLASVTDAAGNPSSPTLGLAVGTPSGATCTTSASVNAAPGLKSQLNTSLGAAGTYCVRITDSGGLSGKAVYVVRVLQNPTSAPSTTPTETFSGNVAIGGSASHSFVAGKTGPVTIALLSVSPTADAGLAIGVPGPSGAGCFATMFVQTPAGADAQLGTDVDPGTYCVKVFDVGTFAGAGGASTMSFVVTVTHP